MLKTKVIHQNTISKYAIVALLILLLSLVILKNHSRKEFIYNYIELHTQYKNYKVIDKYQKDNKYYLIVFNKSYFDTSTKIVYKTIRVTENVYYNLYFVGDNIK
ncbi:hypothetical protein [Intestinibacter sp.]|uniref:hypothetical protein n=1 Tax=Intestinibacter sp. TaxID=1965304 RepID=UPI003F142D61